MAKTMRKQSLRIQMLAGNSFSSFLNAGKFDFRNDENCAKQGGLYTRHRHAACHMQFAQFLS